MRLKPILTAALFSALSCSLSFAQQPAPSAGPAPPADPGQHREHMDPRGFAPGGGGMRHGSRISPSGMWWKNPDIIQRLTLTADQQKRMDDILQQSRLQLIDLRANVEKQEVLLEPMLDVNPPDTNKVLAQIDHVAQARADLEKANARMLLGIRGVLSADQWTKLQADRGLRRHRMMRGPDGPGGRPDRPDQSENRGAPDPAFADQM